MKILITNFRLAERTASELYVCDIARALRAGRNRVSVFVSQKGPLAEQLEKDGVTVVTHPSDVPFCPDIIHGQYNLETLTALLAFPGIPAIYMSHGGLQWREHPPLHPRIRRYLAMSTCVSEMLIDELGIGMEDLTLIPNFVEVDQFNLIRNLPDKPTTALYYDATATARKHVEGIRAACHCCGVEMVTISELVGKVPTRPEILFPNYDLVFGSGRAAIQALAAGCAVITVSNGRFGKLIHSENYDAIRDCNFCVDEEDTQEANVDDLIHEIESYQRENVTPVNMRVRQESDVKVVRKTLMNIYKQVQEEHESMPVPAEAEFPAMAEWLLQLSDQHHSVDRSYLQIQGRKLTMKSERADSNRRTEALHHQLELEREKVRIARKALKDAGLVARGVAKRIEDDWHKVDRENHDQPPPAEPAPMKIAV